MTSVMANRTRPSRVARRRVGPSRRATVSKTHLTRGCVAFGRQWEGKKSTSAATSSRYEVALLGNVGIFCLDTHHAAAPRNTTDTTVDAIRMVRPRRGLATAASSSWGGAVSVGGLSGTATDIGERLLHRRRLGNVSVRLLRVLVRLVVDRLGVHRPDVVACAVADVLDRAHRGQRRVVGGVVAVKTVAADLVQVLDPVQPAFDDLDAVGVLGVVHGIRLWYPDRVATLDLLRAGQAELRELLRRELDEVVVGHRPQVVALEAEVLEPDARLRLVGDHPRAPRAVVLDAAD